MEKLIDTHLSALLTKQGINKDSVELLHDYAPRSRGKEHSPFAQFWADKASGKHVMVTGVLPHVTNAGFFIVPQFRQEDNKFISEENCFHVEITGETVRTVCVNDQPNGRKKDDWAGWHPQVFLDGALQSCGNPLWLDTDVINSSYHFNTIQWDFGFCKRRARIIEGRFRDRITLTEDPHYRIEVNNNRTGNMRLKYGSRDGEGNPIGKVVGDVEIITKEELANATYPITIGASPETFNPDAHPEGGSVDGKVDYVDTGGVSWATIHDAVAGTTNSDDGTEVNALIRRDSATEWDKFSRGFILFDTSGLPDAATKTAAVLSLYGNARQNDFGGSVNIYSSNPGSNTTLENTDYDQVGTTAFATAIAIGVWNTAGYNDFTFNATGRAAVSTTDVSKFSFRNVFDATDSEQAGGAGDKDQADASSVEVGGGEVPKLVVTYTTGWTGGDVDGVAIAGIAKINGVALADITKVNGV